MAGSVASSADAATLKAAHLAISGMIPVVGGILSDATEAVFSGASLLRNSVGIFGVVGVLGFCALPFLRLGIQFLLYKLVAALSATLSDHPAARLIQDPGQRVCPGDGHGGHLRSGHPVLPDLHDFGGDAMTEAIKNWILTILAARCCWGCWAAAPRGRRGGARLAAGLVLFLVVVSPLASVARLVGPGPGGGAGVGGGLFRRSGGDQRKLSGNNHVPAGIGIYCDTGGGDGAVADGQCHL